MEKIKVGDYAKHTKDGYIGKVVDFDNIFVKLDIGRSALRHYIKTAENIIDLIEVGDYVNGRLVLQVDYKNKNVCLLIPFTDTQANTNIMWYGFEDIKSIVTKEQFAQVSYNGR